MPAAASQPNIALNFAYLEQNKPLRVELKQSQIKSNARNFLE